jgi:phospholipase/lecithinase/hemolysin
MAHCSDGGDRLPGVLPKSTPTISTPDIMNHLRIRPSIAAAATVGALLSLSNPGGARPDGLPAPGPGAPFTGIYAFGDSLTDTGNLFDLTGGIPPAPYYDGRLSNGPVWIEYLAEAMGLAPASVVNYAVAGATTGRDNENDGQLPPGDFPGLQDQIDFFEADLAGNRADRRALYVVWAGANDFIISSGSVEQTIATAVENTAIAVQRLFQAGARRIMVVNMPDLGLTPYGALSGNPDGLSGLTAAYNHYLAATLDGLALVGIETLPLDSAGLIQRMVGNPGDFGFWNVTDPFLFTGGDPAGFLFWDFLHPTTHGHFYVAEDAMQVLEERFPHAWVTPRNHARQQSGR